MSNKRHFLLSAKARTLSVRQVFELTEQQAIETFKEVRWGKGDNVACPLCGVLNKHYFIRVRRQWRCCYGLAGVTHEFPLMTPESALKLHRLIE